VLLGLATPVQFILGKKFYVGAYKSLRNRVANMDVLVVLGTTAAYGYSVISIILSAVSGVSTSQFFEVSVLLITFVFLGNYLEAYAKGKTSEAITKLLSLQATKAVLVKVSESFQIISETEVDTEIIQAVGHLFVYPPPLSPPPFFSIRTTGRYLEGGCRITGAC